jgi:hypothetical protein
MDVTGEIGSQRASRFSGTGGTLIQINFVVVIADGLLGNQLSGF